MLTVMAFAICKTEPPSCFSCQIDILRVVPSFQNRGDLDFGVNECNSFFFNYLQCLEIYVLLVYGIAITVFGHAAKFIAVYFSVKYHVIITICNTLTFILQTTSNVD